MKKTEIYPGFGTKLLFALQTVIFSVTWEYFNSKTHNVISATTTNSRENMLFFFFFCSTMYTIFKFVCRLKWGKTPRWDRCRRDFVSLLALLDIIKKRHMLREFEHGQREKPNS